MKFRICSIRIFPAAALIFFSLAPFVRAAVVSNVVVPVLSTPNPIVLGQSDTITAGVNWTGAEAPTGTITLTDTVTCPGAGSATVATLGTVTLGSATSPTPGAGSLVVSSFPCAGSNSIVGAYSGDSNYSAGTSAPLTEIVLAQFSATSTTLSSSPNPSTTGQNVLIGAKISFTLTQSTNPTGIVTFIDTNTSNVLGTAKVQTDGSGKALGSGASMAISSLAAGAYAVEAAYSGDNIYSPSTSGIVNQVVSGSGPALAPSIATNGVVTASQFGKFSSIAPGDWIEIYGSNLAAKTRPWALADFKGPIAPTSLEGTSVSIGGQAAYLEYISPAQVNAQVPSNVATGSQQIVVTSPAGTSAAYTVTVNQTQPGLYAPDSFAVSGTRYVGALSSDGVTFVLPPGTAKGIISQRAKPGEVISLYGVGFGSVIPDIPAGHIVGQNNQLAASLQISFAGTPAMLQYMGLAPQSVGLYQFNVVVPNVAASDTVPVTFTLGGVSGTQTVSIAIQN